VCEACGKPIVGRPTRAPFITLASATLWTHVGPLWRLKHRPVVPERDA
jgi:hypothetical protein